MSGPAIMEIERTFEQTRIALPDDWRQECCDKTGHLFDEGSCLRCMAKQATPTDIKEIRAMGQVAQ